MSKHDFITNDVRNKIKNSEYLPGDKLPNESEMGRIYSASRATVKKALDKLVVEGLIVKIRGSGTFVKNFNDDDHLKEVINAQIEGFTFANRDKDVHSVVLKFSIEQAGELVASKLQISKEEYIFNILRVRYANDKPHVLDHVHMPISLVPNLTRDILDNSIFSYLHDELGLKITQAQRKVKAHTPTEFEKNMLSIFDDTVILEVEQIGYLQNGIPLEYTISKHRSDTTELFYITSLIQ